MGISKHPLPDWPNTGRGREEWLKHIATYERGWRHYQVEIRELIDAGDEVITTLHENVALRDSEATLDRDLHQLYTVRNGAVVRIRVFKSKAEALEAAGLRE
jgi:ketosteroid isomerase-like protein